MVTGWRAWRLELRRGDSGAWVLLALMEFGVVRELHVEHFSVGLETGS